MTDAEIDPNGSGEIATAFRNYKDKLVPRRYMGLASMILEGNSRDEPGGLQVVVSPLAALAAGKRLRHTEAAAKTLATFAAEKAKGTSDVAALDAVFTWADSAKFRSRLRLNDVTGRRRRRAVAAELVADALFAWDWWHAWWPAKQARARQRAERKAAGRKTRSASRLIHGDDRKPIPWVARRTGLNERTLRRQCERGELPADLWGTEAGQKRTWKIRMNLLSADSPAQKEILDRYLRGKVSATT